VHHAFRRLGGGTFKVRTENDIVPIYCVKRILTESAAEQQQLSKLSKTCHSAFGLLSTTPAALAGTGGLALTRTGAPEDLQ